MCANAFVFDAFVGHLLISYITCTVLQIFTFIIQIQKFYTEIDRVYSAKLIYRSNELKVGRGFTN
jgi:hypothetical protein